MQWTIPVVNHTWLEDCFRNWKYIEPSAKMGAYTTFPPGVDWADSLDLRVLEDGERLGDPSSPPTVSSPPKQPILEASSRSNTSPFKSLVHGVVNNDPSIASKPVEPMEVDQLIPPPSSGEGGGSVLEVQQAMADLGAPWSPCVSPGAVLAEISDDEVPAPTAVKVASQPQSLDDATKMEIDNSPSNTIRQTVSPPLSDEGEVPLHKNPNLFPRRSNVSAIQHQVMPLDTDDESDQAA